jgi:hypothetical protein
MKTGEETLNLSEIQDQKAIISTMSSFNNMTQHKTKTWKICTQQPEREFFSGSHTFTLKLTVPF